MAMSAKTTAGLAAAAMVGWAAAPASAQSPGWAGLPMQGAVMRNLLNNATHGQAGPYVAGPRPAPGWAAPAPRYAPDAAGPVGPAGLPYGENPAVTAKVLATYLANVRQHAGPAAADRLQQVLSRMDFRAEWSRMVAADGLRRGDLVDAMTAYWVLNWMIVHDADNDRAQTLAARAQVARALAMTPGLARLDPAGRQALAETLMLRQVVQAAAYLNDRRTHDQAALQALGAETNRDFSRDFGMDLAAYRLTSRGFVQNG